MKIKKSLIAQIVFALFFVYFAGLTNLPHPTTVFNIQAESLENRTTSYPLTKIETVVAPKGNIYTASYQNGQINIYFDKTKIPNEMTYSELKYIPNPDSGKLHILGLAIVVLMGLLLSLCYYTLMKESKRSIA